MWGYKQYSVDWQMQWLQSLTESDVSDVVFELNAAAQVRTLCLQGIRPQAGVVAYSTGINLPSIVDDIMWALQCQQKVEQSMAALASLAGRCLHGVLLKLSEVCITHNVCSPHRAGQVWCSASS